MRGAEVVGSDDAWRSMPRSRAPFSTGGFYPPSSHPYPLWNSGLLSPPDRPLFLFLSSRGRHSDCSRVFSPGGQRSIQDSASRA